MNEKIERALEESLFGLSKFQTRPTEKLWNRTAKEYNYLSSLTLKLITNLKWEDLFNYAKQQARKINERNNNSNFYWN